MKLQETETDACSASDSACSSHTNCIEYHLRTEMWALYSPPQVAYLIK